MRKFYEQSGFAKLFLLLFLLLVFGQLHAQDRTVSGKVTSGEDGSAIPGVSIIVTGTTTGTITDLDGNYKLSVPEGVTLAFSSVGYQSQSIEVGSRSVIDVTMQSDITELSEIVVIGYGTREKKDLTGAISTVDAEDIERSVQMAPELAMQGKMAGVLVSSPSGLPTDRPTVRIRGVSTFGIADPLYVIDGVPITEFGSGFEQGQAVVRDIRGQVNILSMINPDDIESISVLKDASAAAIYGVRASNGVILITTKKGKEGRPKVDMAYSYGVQKIPNVYNLLPVDEYVNLYQESYNANASQPLPAVFDPNATDAANYAAYLGDKPNIDWQQPMLKSGAAASVVDASARVYGGNENTNYYVSTGYSFTEAPILANWQERYSLATNITSKVSDYVEVGVTYRFAMVNALDQANSLSQAVSAPPWQPQLLEDDYYPIGSPVEEKYGYATTVDTVTTPNPDHPMFGGSNADAPPYTVDYQLKYGQETESNYLARTDKRINENEYQIFRNIGNAYIQVEPIKGLKIRGGISGDWYYNRRTGWTSVNSDMFNITPGNPYTLADGLSSVGSQRYRDSKNYNLVQELTVDWLKQFGDHNINVTLNAMNQNYGFNFVQSSSQYITQEDKEKRGFIESEQYTTVGEWTDRYALQGYMARASYNYASKYYADVTVRRDGTSRFAPDYRWGTFPSVALAWRISGENFMGGLTWINDLKIRAGWGQLGNQETAAFAYLSGVNRATEYSFGSGGGNPYGFVDHGLFLPDFPTEDLSWETTTTTNFGFDGIFFNNRITATVEYYNRVTDGILQSVSFPASVGNYSNPIINVAKVLNQGFEFQLGYNGSIGDLQYSFSGNMTTVDNEVLEVWNNQPFIVGAEQVPGATTSVRIEEGYPLYYIWGFQAGGIFQSKEEVEEYQETYSDSQGTPDLVDAGDFYFRDVNGPPDKEAGYDFYTPFPDSIVDLNDRTYIGNTIPKHFYGFTIGANWKGFDLSVFFQGIGDVYKYNNEMAKGVSMSSTGINQWVNVLNRWTPENPHRYDPDDKVNSLPRAIFNDPAGNNRFSDRFVERAGFMRLRNVTVGYSLPTSVLTSAGFIDRVRLYVSGSNLLTFTKWSGNDPENDNFPIPVTWTFGVNATF
ncbi:MAG: TonB-dependent receptor [Cyclobacteriaceae bacterium]|nr:TonB-dependent receptor [Cyclobacteriaceae bacterium]